MVSTFPFLKLQKSDLKLDTFWYFMAQVFNFVNSKLVHGLCEQNQESQKIRIQIQFFRNWVKSCTEFRVRTKKIRPLEREKKEKGVTHRV